VFLMTFLSNIPTILFWLIHRHYRKKRHTQTELMKINLNDL
jgi:hypothetical protein